MSASVATKLFVGRLPEGCTSKDLEDLFGKYGQVTECDVVGKFGFVHMSKKEEADECIKKLHKYAFMGSQLSVEFSTSRVHPQPGTTGRAKGPMRSVKKIDKGRSGYPREPARDRYGHPPPLPPPADGYYSSYYPDDRFERDPYYDRDPYYERERVRPYPSPYERRSYGYDDHYRRPYPPAPPLPPAPPDNIYARRLPSDVYDRRNDISTPMYSTRSPPHSGGMPPNPAPVSQRTSMQRSSEYWNYAYPNGDRVDRFDFRGQTDASSAASRRPPF